MATSRTGTKDWVQLRRLALNRLPLICAACHADLDPKAPRCTPTSPELDHIIPWSKGGQDVIENVQWLCFPCNRAKSDGKVRKAPELIRARSY